MEDEQTELLREMRDLLQVMAEPALAQRDARLRAALAGLVGRSKVKGKAVLLMNGIKSQKEIQHATGIDKGGLSRLLKSLRAAGLIPASDQLPKLLISIPPGFFEDPEGRP